MRGLLIGIISVMVATPTMAAEIDAATVAGSEPVVATTTEVAQAASEVPPQSAAEDKRVCRSERVTGSNMKKRVCKTKAEHEAERKAARELMEMNNRATQASFGQ